jgi:hypothetical protein
LVAANPGPYPGVWATVVCEDIRQEFAIAGASNEVLLQRASTRQTNKEALWGGEIATAHVERTVSQLIKWRMCKKWDGVEPERSTCFT